MTRRDYLQTDELIKDTYLELIKTRKRMPTQEEVAEKCNLTRKTVNLHLNKTNLTGLRKPYKVFGNNVILALYRKAIKGDVQAIKLFLSLIFDYNEKIEHDVEGTIETIIKVHYEDEDEIRD
jgi:hypothetical protein